MRLPAKLLIALALLTALPAPQTALADGDPASDVLLGENVFYPYSPAVSAPLQQSLNAETVAAARARFPLKVALIASPVDLGVVPDLFDKPQQYADFLDQEISFQAIQPLLVVMPDGYGAQGVSAAAKAAVESLPKPAGGQSDDLAKAAMTAVQKLAAASGHPLPGQAVGSGGGSSGGSSAKLVLLVVLVIAALATAGTVIALRRRRATRA